MIDNRALQFPKEDIGLVKSLCDRHYGIGADGLILLENDVECDFAMVYYNADGHESTLCGNGGRCIVAFAKQLGLITEKTQFRATDGLHQASIENEIVTLHMNDVNQVEIYQDHCFANTGSPHHVVRVDAVADYPVVSEGRRIRNELYGEQGSNVNFITQKNEHTFAVRTYERGVEDETLACGTGVTAAALAMHATQRTAQNELTIEVQGGKLQVGFEESNGTYTNIVLIGPAQFVYEGKISVA